MAAKLGAAALMILAGSAAGGATYLFFGSYWFELGQLSQKRPRGRDGFDSAKGR